MDACCLSVVAGPSGDAGGGVYHWVIRAGTTGPAPSAPAHPDPSSRFKHNPASPLPPPPTPTTPAVKACWERRAQQPPSDASKTRGVFVFLTLHFAPPRRVHAKPSLGLSCSRATEGVEGLGILFLV